MFKKTITAALAAASLFAAASAFTTSAQADDMHRGWHRSWHRHHHHHCFWVHRHHRNWRVCR